MSLPAYGALQRLGLKIEGTFDTPQALLAADAVGLEELEIKPSQNWIETKEHITGNGELHYEAQGKQGGTFSLKGPIRVPAAGSAPDLAAVFKAAGFTETLTGGTSALYEQNSNQPSSLQLVRHVDASFQQVALGAVVEKLGIEVVGGALPMLTASGSFARYGLLKGTPVVEGAVLAGVATVTLETAFAFAIRPGVLVKFGAEDNGGAGYLVTSVGATGLALGISPALAGNIADGVVVAAMVVAAPGISGNVEGAIACGLTVDAVAVGFISYKLDIDTGIHLLDKEATSNRATRAGRGLFRANGTLGWYLLEENAVIAANAWRGTTRAVVCRVGPNVASERLTITHPKVRMAISDYTVPEGVEVEQTTPLVGRADAGNDTVRFLFA